MNTDDTKGASEFQRKKDRVGIRGTTAIWGFLLIAVGVSVGVQALDINVDTRMIWIVILAFCGFILVLGSLFISISEFQGNKRNKAEQGPSEDLFASEFSQSETNQTENNTDTNYQS